MHTLEPDAASKSDGTFSFIAGPSYEDLSIIAEAALHHNPKLSSDNKSSRQTRSSRLRRQRGNIIFQAVQWSRRRRNRGILVMAACFVTFHDWLHRGQVFTILDQEATEIVDWQDNPSHKHWSCRRKESRKKSSLCSSS